MSDALVVIPVATLAAILCRKLNFTPIPLYILVGMLMGQAGIIEGDETGKFLGSLGIVFLLFYIGLKINPKTLRTNIGGIALAGLIDFVFNFTPAFILLSLLGFDLLKSFILASAIYISSSAVNLKLLIDGRKLIYPFAETVVWLMVFEDVVLIAILSVLSAREILSFLLIIPLLALVYVIYRSNLLSGLFKRDDEVPVLLIFTIPSLALLVAEKLKLSEALIAISLGISFSRHGIDSITRPFKDIFLAIFFVFFGTLITFKTSDFSIVLLLAAIAVTGKFVSGYVIGKFIHGSTKDGVEIFKHTVARGEFSVILSSLFALENAGIIAGIVLLTSVLGPILTKMR